MWRTRTQSRFPLLGLSSSVSEEKDHPIDHVFDSNRGPGGHDGSLAQPGVQTIIVAFDSPQTIHQVHLEIEEPEISRTQELQLALSTDGGVTYRELLRQEYNFSPPGTMFEQERTGTIWDSKSRTCTAVD